MMYNLSKKYIKDFVNIPNMRWIVGIIVLLIFISSIQTAYGNRTEEVKSPDWSPGDYWRYTCTSSFPIKLWTTYYHHGKGYDLYGIAEDEWVLFNETMVTSMNDSKIVIEIRSNLRAEGIWKGYDSGTGNFVSSMTGNWSCWMNVTETWTCSNKLLSIKKLKREVTVYHEFDNLPEEPYWGNITAKITYDIIYENEEKYIIFPLKVGNVWGGYNYMYITKSINSTGYGAMEIYSTSTIETENIFFLSKYKAEMYEVIDTPIGRFGCIVINNTLKIGDEEETRMMYYSEDAENYVKIGEGTFLVGKGHYPINPPILQSVNGLPFHPGRIYELEEDLSIEIKFIAEDMDGNDINWSFEWEDKELFEIENITTSPDAQYQHTIKHLITPTQPDGIIEYHNLSIILYDGTIAPETNYVVIFAVVNVNDPPCVIYEPPPVTLESGGEVITNWSLHDIFYDEDLAHGLPDNLTYDVLKQGILNVSITSDDKLHISAPMDFAGETNVLIRATDNASGIEGVPGYSTTYNLKVKVIHTNHPPYLTDYGENLLNEIITWDEDKKPSPINLSKIFTDADFPFGDSLTYEVKNSTHIFGEIHNCELHLRSEKDWFGSERIEVFAYDKNGSYLSIYLNCYVAPLDDPPRVILNETIPDREININEGDSVELIVSAVDPEGDFLEYEWEIRNNANKILKKKIGTKNFVFESEYTGNFSSIGSPFTVKVVIYANNVTGDTFTWVITVINVNRLPEVKIISPINNSKFFSDDKIKFVGNATDPDEDSNLYYTWYDNNKVIHEGIGEHGRIFEMKMSPGRHLIILEVKDSSGGTASHNVEIHVVEREKINVSILITSLIIITGIIILFYMLVKKRKNQ